MAEVARLLEAGNLHRAVAAHNLNEHSSRSHAICTLHLEQRRRSAAPAARDAPRFLRAKLHLVDLAGACNPTVNFESPWYDPNFLAAVSPIAACLSGSLG